MRGASDVVIDWIDDEISHMGYEYKTKEQLEIIPEWSIDKSEYYFKKGVNLIKVYASDPGLLADIDPEKVAAYAKAHAEAFKKLMKYTMNDICSWCVVSIPQKNWANKVFPDMADSVDKKFFIAVVVYGFAMALGALLILLLIKNNKSAGHASA